MGVANYLLNTHCVIDFYNQIQCTDNDHIFALRKYPADQELGG